MGFDNHTVEWLNKNGGRFGTSEYLEEVKDEASQNLRGVAGWQVMPRLRVGRPTLSSARKA